MEMAAGPQRSVNGAARWRNFGWVTLTMLSVAIALFSLRYVPAVGPRPPSILNNLFARPWLATHAGAASVALLLGPLNFLAHLRERRPLVHRWLGRVYISACLLGAAAGFVLACGTTAGPLAGVSFFALATAWTVCGVQGWRTARARRFAAHREWMIRSWALTLSAVTLRIYLFALRGAGVPPEIAYLIDTFISWFPNLILAEIWIRHTRGGVPTPSSGSTALVAAGCR